MASKLELMLEAERRGILPPDKVAILNEARARGLVPASASAAEAPPAEPDTPPEHGLSNNIAQGVIRGAAGIGTTLLWPVDAITDLISPKQRTLADVVAGTSPESSHQKRKRQIEEVMHEVADTDSLGFKGGKLGTEIAGTAGVGGALGKGAAALGADALVPALESGGFTLGDKIAKTNVLARMLARLGAGGAVGGASTALIDPEHAGTGAAIGAALPGGVAFAGGAGKLIGDVVTSGTKSGIERAAAKVLQESSIDPRAAAAAALTYMPKTEGVQPTLAEATLDPGLSALQRASGGKTVAARETANRRILVDELRRLGATDDVIKAAVDAREATTGPMYRAALDDVRVPGDEALNTLMDRPSMNEAVGRSMRLGREKGLKLVEGQDIPARTEIVPGQGVPAFPGSQSYGSVSRETPYVPSQVVEHPDQYKDYLAQGLQYMKMSMDDIMAGEGGQGMAAHERAAVKATQDKLLGWLESKLPDYMAANAKYRELSQPINQMKIGNELFGEVVPASSELSDVVTRLKLGGLATALRDKSDKIAERAAGKWGSRIEDMVSPEFMKKATGIAHDLSREQAAYDAALTRGSSTGANIGVQDLVSRSGGILGLDPKLQAIASVIGKLRPFKSRIDEQVSGALVDPRRAAELLQYSPKTTASEYLEAALAKRLANPALRAIPSALVAD